MPPWLGLEKEAAVRNRNRLTSLGVGRWGGRGMSDDERSGFRSISFWNWWYKPVVPGSIWEEVVMICFRVYRLPVCDSWLVEETAHVPTGASASSPGQVSLSVRSAFPSKPQRTPKHSPLQKQTEPAPFSALWSCVFLPSVLHPSGKACGCSWALTHFGRQFLCGLERPRLGSRTFYWRLTLGHPYTVFGAVCTLCLLSVPKTLGVGIVIIIFQMRERLPYAHTV